LSHTRTSAQIRSIWASLSTNDAASVGKFSMGGKHSTKHQIMKLESLEILYVEELRDIYNAENQLLKALPKMAKAASSPELKQGFEDHLELTKEHVTRLEEIFEKLDKKPTGKTCKAMKGLVE